MQPVAREQSEIEKENQRLVQRVAEVEQNREDVAKDYEKILDMYGILELKVCGLMLFVFLRMLIHLLVEHQSEERE
jgi:uncharacterized protein YbbK (DUF523 family)